jgi:Anti-sigma factor NepR
MKAYDFSPVWPIFWEPTQWLRVGFRVKSQGTSKNMQQEMTQDPTKARLKDQIDENLKRVYNDALKEEVPDRFKELLAKLKNKEEGK